MVPKFRAWDKEENLWIKVASLVFDEEGELWYLSPVMDDFNPVYYENELGQTWEIMQSTGLKDKNGVEIFEGDVLLHTSSSVNYSDTYWHSYVQVYRMDSGAYRIKGKHIYDTELMSARNRLEVVGNIYQNQDLLDKEYFSTSDGIVEQANEN